MWFETRVWHKDEKLMLEKYPPQKESLVYSSPREGKIWFREYMGMTDSDKSRGDQVKNLPYSEAASSFYVRDPQHSDQPFSPGSFDDIPAVHSE